MRRAETNRRDHERATSRPCRRPTREQSNPGSQTARGSLDEWFSPFPSRQAQQATRAGLTCNARQLHVPPGQPLPNKLRPRRRKSCEVRLAARAVQQQQAPCRQIRFFAMSECRRRDPTHASLYFLYPDGRVGHALLPVVLLCRPMRWAAAVWCFEVSYNQGLAGTDHATGLDSKLCGNLSVLSCSCFSYLPAGWRRYVRT